MKVIEKTTRDGDSQTFEVIETRKELQSFLKDLFWDSLHTQYGKTGIWEDGDTSVDFYDKDGNYTGYREGDQVKRYNYRNIDRLVSTNADTTVIYGNVPIVYNDHYGDWETILD